jgi:hypothetical protein
MPFAVEFFFDPETDARIQGIWRDVGEQAAVAPMTGRPHLTVAIWDALDLDTARSWLASYATQLPPFEIGFASVGFFANAPAVAFLAPIVTRHLLDVQASLCDSFQGGAGENWSYTRPGRWVPHCTFAMGLDDVAFPRVMDCSRHIPLPLHGTVSAIGIVEFPALLDHGTWTLTGGQ